MTIPGQERRAQYEKQISPPPPPEPVEGQDYYVDELYEYTVCIEIYVRGLEGSYSESEVCADAVRKFKNGTIDGDASVVNSEHVKDIELCFATDEPFDTDEWRRAKLLEMGIHADGSPLRPHERGRSNSETTLDIFMEKSYDQI